MIRASDSTVVCRAPRRRPAAATACDPGGLGLGARAPARLYSHAKSVPSTVQRSPIGRGAAVAGRPSRRTERACLPWHAALEESCRLGYLNRDDASPSSWFGAAVGGGAAAGVAGGYE